jgi:hypothetical protein
MTRRDEMLAAIYREHPRLRLLSTGVEAMVDWFLRDPDGFKKHMARHERESKRDSKRSCPTIADPKTECILTCVSKRSSDEVIIIIIILQPVPPMVSPP